MNANNIIIALALLCAFSFTQSLYAQEEDFNFNNSSSVDPYEFTERLNKVRGIMIQEDERVATAKSYKKIDQGLQAFLETAFIKKLKDFKIEAESLTSTFKATQQSFKPKQVAMVKKAYLQFADKYNLQLDEIKRDFLDNKKLKFIRKYPDMYAASLELKLRDLSDEYSQNLEKTVADLTGSDEYAAFPILAVLTIVKFGVDFTNHLARVRFSNRKVKEEHLNQYFIQPYKIRSWDEIQGMGGDVYNQMGGMDTPFPSEPGLNGNMENEEPVYEMNPFEQ